MGGMRDWGMIEVPQKDADPRSSAQERGDQLKAGGRMCSPEFTDGASAFAALRRDKAVPPLPQCGFDYSVCAYMLHSAYHNAV